MHTACHNVYTLTAHVTGFRRVLVTPHALVYERNAASELTLCRQNSGTKNNIAIGRIIWLH